jgi:hypothetical protein
VGGQKTFPKPRTTLILGRYSQFKKTNNMKQAVLTVTIFLLFTITIKSQVRIKMQKAAGVYTTPCLVNGLRLYFIFDTGASNVSISLSEAIFMLKNGYLDENDLHGSSFSQIANGDIVENTTVNLKEIEIGGIKIYNVSAPLLLGQSAIQKLGKIQIDNDELVIMDINSHTSKDACSKAIPLLNKAREYYNNELYVLSSKTYQKAFDLCPEKANCIDLSNMGIAYSYNNNYENAIKFLEKALRCETNKPELYLIFGELGKIFYEINEPEKAILYFQKAITVSSENSDYYWCYFGIALNYSHMEKYDKAITAYEKSSKYYLKDISASINEVMKGKIEDETLGEIFWNIAVSSAKNNEFKKADNFTIKSALCGYDEAIEYCTENDLKYELYIE